jgi:hypothetical protein
MRETVHIPVSPGVIIEGELSFPSEQGGSTTTICLTSGRGVIQTFGSSSTSSSPTSSTSNQQSKGIVVFVNGSDSIRCSPRYQFVARVLNDVGLTTLIVDLLTPQEEKLDQTVNHLRFDLPLLSHRLEGS